MSLVISELQKSGYYLDKYITTGGEAVVFDGFIRKNKFPEECVFKIIFNGDSHELQEEVSLMKRFDNSLNIIKFIDFVSITKEISVTIFEKCQHSLKKELELNRSCLKFFDLKQFLNTILDLFDGLIQLRLSKILHLDIKPDNILIKSDGSYVYADFGLSKMYSKQESIKVKGYSLKYAPKELLRNEQESNIIGYNSDIYSLGKTLQEMIEIFKGVNQNYKIITEIQNNILNKMIKEEYEKREDCVKCHEMLIMILKQFNQEDVLYSYTKRLEIILHQFHLKNERLNYFSLHTKLYYSLIHLQIKEYMKLAYDNVLQYEQLSFKMKRGVSKINHPDIATSLNNIGLCYRDIGDSENALRYQFDSLKMRKELFKGNHPDIATSLNNIGLCYRDIGDSENALRYQLDSLKMINELFKGNHPLIASSLSNVGLCYRDMGDSENALRYQLDSLKMRKELFKGNHPSIAICLDNLILIYNDIGDKETALNYEQEAIIMKQLLKQ